MRPDQIKKKEEWEDQLVFRGQPLKEVSEIEEV
jgi:hypothetical protein